MITSIFDYANKVDMRALADEVRSWDGAMTAAFQASLFAEGVMRSEPIAIRLSAWFGHRLRRMPKAQAWYETLTVAELQRPGSLELRRAHLANHTEHGVSRTDPRSAGGLNEHEVFTLLYLMYGYGWRSRAVQPVASYAAAAASKAAN